MATFTYIDSQGRERTVEAPDEVAAMAGAEDIAPNSGVMLSPRIAPQPTDSINLGQVDLSVVPVNLQQPTPPPAPTVQPFVSAPTLTQEVNTEEQRLASERTRLQNEISTLESRISGRAAQRETALGDAGVFEDLQRLNELRAEQRRVEDREIEIPIEARGDLRGRGATRTEFGQTIAPRLENQALEALAASRRTSALTDAINTNIAIIDQRINAEKEADEFLFNQRQNQLNTIETAYSTILSDRQKAALEEAKFQNSLIKDEINANREERKALLEKAAGFATPEQLTRLYNSTNEEIVAFNLQNGGIAEARPRAEAADSVIDTINNLLSNTIGLSSSVGATALGRTRGGGIPILGAIGGLIETGLENVTGIEGRGGKIAEFRGQAEQLFSDKVLQTLIDLKAAGGTLGALSDTELAMLEKASTALRPVKDGEKFTGQFAVSEKAFKEGLEIMRRAAMKVAIASRNPNSFDARGNFILKDASDAELARAYNELSAVETPQVQYDPVSELGGVSTRTSGNLPQRNFNPGNVKGGGLAAVDSLAVGRDEQGHLIFPNEQAGFTALALDLQAKLNGNSRFVQANPTIAQLGRVWAEDTNWANAVSRILGVSPDTRATDIDFEQLVRAIARQEGYFA